MFRTVKFFLIVVVLILFESAIAQDTALVSKIRFYKNKVDTYLDKEKSLSSYYSIDTNGISIFESAQKKEKKATEYFIPWNQIDSYKQFLKACDAKSAFENYSTGNNNIPINNSDKAFTQQALQEGIEKKLKGFKIAIDPGHIAGDLEMGNIEKKSLTFKNNNVILPIDSIRIAEGMLTFATAKLLKEKLESEGAEVFMTRNFNGSSAFGITFDDWLKTSYSTTVDSLFKAGKISVTQKEFFHGHKASKRDKFRVIFKDVELAKRAEIINNYHPDFTIIIHFNVDETNVSWTKPSTKNFNMAFVGGAFMKDDLSTPQKRFEFLRLLISDDLEQSITLSSAVISSFEKNLQVKTAKQKDAEYLTEGCLPTSESGVFCRNLQLPRYIHGPLVYGETLYQDNVSECVLLFKETDKTKNERVQQVAEAYFQGVLDFVQKKKQP
jgi:N-acetylmuramoyl-L-alanine amidase